MTLRSASGQTRTVPLNSLSAVDRAYVQSRVGGAVPAAGGSAGVPGEVHNFRNARGQVIQGIFVSLQGNTVALKLRTGATQNFLVTQFSAADRLYIQQMAAKQAAAGGAAGGGAAGGGDAGGADAGAGQ